LKMNKELLEVDWVGNALRGIINLEAPKSESNRVLIINALAGGSGTIENLSEARDTQTMSKLLNDTGEIWDVLDAGTTMRFLTAYAAVKGLKKSLTGTARMKERPIQLLIDALREIGVEIEYLEKEGFPPHRIIEFVGQGSAKIAIRGDVSSQYISALLMIAPMLPRGLTLELVGKVGSKPYIDMTLSLMELFGVEPNVDKNIIEIKPKPYVPANYKVEPDWSGASYWYSMVALAKSAEVKLIGLRKNSFQGDIAISDIMRNLGVSTQFEEDGVTLTKNNVLHTFEYDFSDCPDLAQTVSVACGALQIPAIFKGLESLRIKETDRIAALQTEMAKFGAGLEEISTGVWRVAPGNDFPDKLEINTYEDHRMAMAFAPLALMTKLYFDDASVVNKSYPSFWRHLDEIGFKVVKK
jgi:3-phosphoshikimate 1-carboxyvinyltransferase